MTIPSMNAVGNRIGQIQNEFRRSMPVTRTFAEALQSAEDQAVAPAQAFTVSPLGLNDTNSAEAIPFGILGTPIQTHTGMVVSASDGAWAGRLPTAGQAWVAEIERAADAAGLDPRLLAAMVWQESRFQPDAVSHSGAIGLAQLMPGTAEGLDVDPWDPVQNLDGGARYLAWTIKEFGSIELGLAAYNAGPGRVREANGIPNIAETQAYVPRVLDYYRQLGGIA